MDEVIVTKNSGCVLNSTSKSLKDRHVFNFSILNKSMKGGKYQESIQSSSMLNSTEHELYHAHVKIATGVAISTLT